jgi:type II secretory pathway pseudopilin PulG
MRSRTEPPRRGFTLIEGLVALLILTAMMIGLLTLLDSSNRLAKQETQVSDAQGSGRSAIYEVTRLIRQARTGQLSPANAVMPWVNNATAATPEIVAGSVNHTIRPGTDAIELRGIFFGETYYFGPADVVCAGGACTGADTATVTLRQLTPTGYSNFPAGGRPEIATRTEPFYFVVTSTRLQSVTATDSGGTGTYALPLYYVGRVDAEPSGAWIVHNATATPATFTFTVTFGDAGAQALNATSTTTVALQDPVAGGLIFSGGAIDRVVLFVDRGPQDPDGAYTHPYLAQAVAAADGTWSVQRLVDDVEDLQFAYGIDGLDGSVPDRGVDPAALSTTANADEWAYNVTDDTALVEQSGPRRIEGFLAGPASAPTSAALRSMVTPSLRAILVSVVVKSLDPDIKFSGPGASGIRTLDSTAPPVSTQPYRRRAQTMAVNLRNYV